MKKGDKVICVSKDAGLPPYEDDGVELLKLGEIYTVSSVEYAEHTCYGVYINHAYLEEFPLKVFNMLCFQIYKNPNTIDALYKLTSKGIKIAASINKRLKRKI